VPDIAIVGGGIIGAACAYELSLAGASVTLIERDELAAGASGRNQGWFVLPEDPLLEPMARLEIEPTVIETQTTDDRMTVRREARRPHGASTKCQLLEAKGRRRSGSLPQGPGPTQ